MTRNGSSKLGKRKARVVSLPLDLASLGGYFRKWAYIHFGRVEVGGRVLIERGEIHTALNELRSFLSPSKSSFSRFWDSTIRFYCVH